MAKTRQTGQTGSSRRWVSLLAWGSLGLGMTVAAGCSTTPVANAPPADPLYGVPPESPLSTPKADAGTVAPVPQAANAGGVPALPTSFSSSNPATLASRSGQSPLGPPLAITDPGTGPPFLPGAANVNRKAQAPAALGSSPSPKVEQVPDSAPPTAPIGSVPTIQPAVQPVSASQPTGDDALRKLLEERGVINQKVSPDPKGVLLTCYISRGPGLPLGIVEWPAIDYATAAQAILQVLPPRP